MTQTLASLIAIGTHASGIHSVPAGITFEGLVHEAGTWMTGLRAWSYLRAPDAFLSVVANQDYIDLPDSYGRLLAVDAVDSIAGMARWIAPETMNAMRARPTTAGALLQYVSIGWSAPSTTAPVTQRLLVYPEQTAAVPNAFRVQYLAGWKRLEGDNDFASIPADGSMDTLLRLSVAAFFSGYLKEAEATLDERLAALLAGPALHQAAIYDGLRQSNMGPVLGGAAMEGYCRIYDHTFTEFGVR